MSELTFSHNTVEWATPQDLYDHLDALYHFDLDVAATSDNAKCKQFYTVADDGLRQDWGGHRVWCNPPYGRQLSRWVRKAYEESRKPGTIVVMLLPARTHTAWFHDYARKGDVIFLRGRLRFGNSIYQAPFPSMVVKFERELMVKAEGK